MHLHTMSYTLLNGDGKKPRFQLHNEIQSVRLTFLDKIICTCTWKKTTLCLFGTGNIGVLEPILRKGIKKEIINKYV